MKARKKHILSRSGVGYKVVLDDDKEQVQIICLLFNRLKISRKKRDIQNALNARKLDLDMVADDKTSVTYKCPKHMQRQVLRAIAKS